MLTIDMSYGKSTKSKCRVCGREVTINNDAYKGYTYSCICGIKEDLGKLYNESWGKSIERRIYI